MLFHLCDSFSAFLCMVCMCVCMHMCVLSIYIPFQMLLLTFHPHSTAAELNSFIHLLSLPLLPTLLPIAGLQPSIITCSSIPESWGSHRGKAFLSLSLAGNWTSWRKLNLQTIQKGIVSSVIAAQLL